MKTNQTYPGERLSFSAVLLLLLVCIIWGGNAVSIKLSITGMPPIMAAAVRSLIAGGLVWIYARWKGHGVGFPKGERHHALIIGLLFGLDIVFLYWGIAFTPASRSNIFLYSHPFWVAMGAHFVIRTDRLTPFKVMGLVLAFCGILIVFQDRSPELPASHWIGDTMELVAAIFWAATTLYIKRISQRVVLNHYQTLFAQLIFGFPILLLGSCLFERSAVINLSATVLCSLAFQCIVVAFFSYLLWFWMIHHFTVSRLTAFTFLAPVFGVILGAIILGESVTTMVWVGLCLVSAGIYIVNK
jgi:drug/metabolite transporter (DMT)-like permease